MTPRLTRRGVLRGLGLGAPALLSGCLPTEADPAFDGSFLSLGEWLSYRTSRLLAPNALAREYPPEAMSPVFRVNGNTDATEGDYARHFEEGFANWRLTVDGLVERPLQLPLAEIRAMPARTQITRHDCVEGWSAIGQWTGVRLSAVLERAGLKPDARFIVFHCADKFGPWTYYESIDLVDAFHEQTILAYGMNGRDLPRGHGAPLRLRVERQLGYKHAKFVRRVEAVSTLDGIGYGRGGFWEDIASYEWFAGI